MSHSAVYLAFFFLFFFLVNLKKIITCVLRYLLLLKMILLVKFLKRAKTSLCKRFQAAYGISTSRTDRHTSP